MGITLPYSGKCHFKDVVTGETWDYSPEECDDIKRKSLIITTDALRTIIGNIQKNCALNQCVELRGKLDSILIGIDQGLGNVP